MIMYNRLSEAFANLFSAKLRSILALLGILVGTASVVAMVSAGQFATGQALQQLKNLGTDLLSVNFSYVGQSSDTSNPKTKISLPTVLQMPAKIPAIKALAPYATLYLNATFQGKSTNSTVVGTTGDFATINKLQIDRGRFISLLDRHSFYCTVGSNTYKILKQFTFNPIGKQIRLGPNIFTIIGALKPITNNSFVDADINNSIYVPIQTAFLLNKYSRISDVIIKLQPKTVSTTAENQIRNYLTLHTYMQKIYFRSSAQIMQSIHKQQAIFTILLGFIGGISLLVGGIGVMNIMLVAVNERRREIGIRRAVGATRKDIRFLFLTESIILALTGGILGVLIGILAAFLIAETKHWGFHILLSPPLIGFTVSVLTGVFFGFYPAYKASKLEPITALHAE